jgi:hypothetical protein
VITGLSNGSSYQFTVVAINGIGSSSASTPSASVTPATVANAPTNVQATRGNTSAIVSWTAPANNGGDSVTLYIVTADPSGLTCSTGGTQCAVGGLTNGVEYTFTVVAQNSVGDSVPSQPSNAVTPASVPDVVTGLSAVPGDGEVTVSWNATNGNGSGIQQYRVTAYPGEATCTTQTTSCVVQGLTNGVSYEFLVVATNVVGDSPESEFVGPVIPAGVPSAPSNVTALRGDKQAVVSWSASDARGSAITGYRVTASTNGQTCTTATTTCTVTGLVNGVAVSFVVVAINAIGESVASSASVSIKPAGLPKAPTTLRGTSAAVKKMLLQWSGASGNGSPIVRYEFSWKAATSSTWKPWKSTGLVRKAVVLGWLKGKKYQFKVRVVTSVGRAVSKTVTVIPTK